MMNRSSLTLFSFLLLELQCFIFAIFGLFILTDPALALVGNTPAPKPEVLWATMHISKPAITPPQITPPAPVTDVPTQEAPALPEETPVAEVDPSYDDSLFPDDGRWIDVNLSEQQIYAYEGNTLVNTFIVSTGLPDTPTVTGEYRIYVKVPLQDMSGPGYYLTDVPWVMFFYEDYGLHGTYWHNNFGMPMSRGCVNLSVDDAAWLYNWASVGTPVSVHY
jgi:lipoprotein-anchoring transpeptidase ErfK/SrfK